MVTIADLAAAMKTRSMRAMGKLVGLTPPFSLSKLIAVATKQGVPRTPHIPSSFTKPQPPTFPCYWSDDGADHFWRATSYDVRWANYGSGGDFDDLPDPPGPDHEVTSPNYAMTPLGYGAKGVFTLVAKNAFGHSARARGFFEMGDPPPSQPSQPGHGTTPPATTGPRAFGFWNCDSVSGATLRLDLADLTSHTAQSFDLPFASVNGGCGPGITNPGASVTLIAGHAYQWTVTRVDTGNQLWGGTFTGGTGAPLILVWPING